MTRLERRIHCLIEKTIVEHGYVLRDARQSMYGHVHHQQRDCCLRGAIMLGATHNPDSVPELDFGRTEAILGITREDIRSLECGWEASLTDVFDWKLYQLGASLRERYVVNP